MRRSDAAEEAFSRGPFQNRESAHE
jgi:hypothetical protein